MDYVNAQKHLERCLEREQKKTGRFGDLSRMTPEMWAEYEKTPYAMFARLERERQQRWAT